MKVIVYGTLKKGGRLHSYMRDSKFLMDVAVKGFKMYDSKSGFPFIEEGDEDDHIWGEKYEIDEGTLRTLDIVEGIDEGLFKRVDLKELKGWSDSRDSVYIYVGTLPSMYMHQIEPAEIKSGRWDIDKI